MPNGHSLCQMPCALRNHLRIDPLTNLSQQVREIIFQHWVVTARNVLPSLSPAERLTCPLLWCGTNFVDHDSLLYHLKNCPYLSHSAYWCPHCHRAESFAINKIPEAIPEPILKSDNQRPAQKKPSPLTKLLLKTFKRKRATKFRQGPASNLSPSPQELNSNQAEMGGQDGCWELHGNPMLYSGGLEAGSEKLERQIVSDYTNSFPPHELPTGKPLTLNGSIDELLSQLRHPNEFLDYGTNGSGQLDPRSHNGGYIDNTSTKSHQSVSSFVVIDHGAVSPQTIDAVFGGCRNVNPGYYDNSGYSPRPAPQDLVSSQIDGRSSDLGKLGHQHGPFAGYHTPGSEASLYNTPRPSYDPPHRRDPSQICGKPVVDPQLPSNTVDSQAEYSSQTVGQYHPNPDTGPQASPLFAGGQQPWSPAAFDRTPRPAPPGSESSYAGNSVPIYMEPKSNPYPSVNTAHVSAECDAQGVRRYHPNPETGLRDPPLFAGGQQPWSPPAFDRTPGSTTVNFQAEYSRQTVRQYHPNPDTGPQASPLFAGGQQPWSPAAFDRTPRPAPPGSESSYARNSVPISMRPTSNPYPSVNTTHVSAERNSQKFRGYHSNPETGPQNSPQSASSSYTDTTWSGKSTATTLTPVTPYSASYSPVDVSLRNLFNPGSSGRYTCPKCNRNFNDRANFTRHKKTHGEVVPTDCRAGCGAHFSRRDNEVRHYKKSLEKEQKKGDTGIHLGYANQQLSEMP